MQNNRKHRPGRILRIAYPIAKYAAVLLIPLNLYRLPRQTWLLPGISGPREVLMLWPALLMLLGLLSDRRILRAKEQDRQEQKNKTSGKASHCLSFLALCVPGLILLNIAAIAHLYISWYHSATAQPENAVPILPGAVMAIGCVLWIYGCCLPQIPFGSIWGLRTGRTLSSPEAWQEFHHKCMPCFQIAGALFLAIGTFILP